MSEPLPDEWEIEEAWRLFIAAKDVVEQYIDGLSSSDTNHDAPGLIDEHSYSSIPLSEFLELSQLAAMLNQYENTAYGSFLTERSGISPSVLSKILRSSGSVNAKDALDILDKFKSILIEIENDIGGTSGGDPENSLTPPPKRQRSDIKTEAWVTVDGSSAVAELIHELTLNLEQVISILQKNNSLAELDGVAQLRMARLKAVLQTTLNLLDSPLIETGILHSASSIAKSAAEEFAKEELKKGLGVLMNVIHDKLIELYVVLTNPQ